VVIDADLGRSGAQTAGRTGFKELVADVGLGKVGIVLGIEVSRPARNNAAECEIVASTRCPSLWPNVILEKFHSFTTAGHFAFATHFRPLPNRWIQA
jgi:hypothetical protein